MVKRSYTFALVIVDRKKANCRFERKFFSSSIIGKSESFPLHETLSYAGSSVLHTAHHSPRRWKSRTQRKLDDKSFLSVINLCIIISNLISSLLENHLPHVPMLSEKSITNCDLNRKLNIASGALRLPRVSRLHASPIIGLENFPPANFDTAEYATISIAIATHVSCWRTYT